MYIYVYNYKTSTYKCIPAYISRDFNTNEMCIWPFFPMPSQHTVLSDIIHSTKVIMCLFGCIICTC